MRKSRLIFSLGMLLVLLTASLSINQPVSAAASDLFISEYIEGSSFNKAIELYNGTGTAVDLSTYTVELYSNGAASPSQSVALSGSLADGDVFVLAHSSANAAILAEADLISGSVINFNGDDAVVLRNNGAVIDAFGQVGFDPGSSWDGGGANVTQRRAETICAGDVDASDAFDASVEWVTFAQDTVDGLGSHTAVCGATFADELFMSEYIEGSSFNKAIEIYNGTAAAVDLSTYTLELYSNGAASPSQSVALSGTLAAGDVFVLAHGSANAAILAEADLISSSVINFNGDDAVVLRNNGAVVDAFGQVGFDPGSSWPGGGANVTLRRAEAICAGDIIETDEFDSSLEWTSFAQDTVDGLGSHTAVCGGSVASPKINEFSASTVGADVEYVELVGAPNTDYSAYTILEIEGDSNSNMGTIDEVIPVGSTDANGFWLVNLPANALENGTVTLLLVQDFTGAFEDDLDVDNDGILDAEPWTAVADAVAVNDGGAGDLTYGTPALGPNYDGVSSFAPGGASRIPDGFDTDSATDWVRNDFDLAGIPGFSGSIGVGEAYNTPGAANEIYVAPPLSCETQDVSTPIYVIQGSGAASAMDGTAVVIDGVVVGDFQENDGDHTDLDGFYVQDPIGDGDPATSDGIFVFAPGAVNVNPGDIVRVSGTVDEFFTMTEITGVDNVLICGTGGSVDPTLITIPTNNIEQYEGMLVTVEHRLYISEYFNFDRFGEIVLTPERQFQPTAVYAPGSPEASALMAENLANRITLDDGRTSQNPDPAIHPNGAEFTLDNLFRGGDGLDNVTGVIDYRFDLYRIQPTTGADYVSLNPRTAAPDPVGGSLQVASFNVLNYFNGDGQGGGFPTARGASDLAEFNRQRDKIIAALVTIDADVVGLMEIENDGYGQYAAIADLVNGLNDATAPGTYAFINPGVPVIGTDEIAVGLIYKPASVTPFGASAILDSSVDIRFDDTKNRPALAQSFIQNSDGAVFTVVVNHLKSKGSACDGDPDLGDGAGNCNITRTLAAQALVDWLASDPTGSGDPDALIIGDLNSYDKEDPIMAILAGPDDLAGTSDDYTDMAFAFGGEFAYSYVFDGALGYLDYALANSSLAGQVTGTTEWHINADEPDLIDYDMSFKQDAQDLLYNADPYRASDHDPVIVGLDLTAPSAGHVTGGGWLIAPAGSLVAAPEASGRANFGFNAKYKKNGRLNSETEFQVQFDDFHFHAKNAQWLLVSGANAYYFGQGRVEESNHTYSFLVSIIDGKLSGGEDMFRIQIWDMSAGNALVFDSQPGDATYADPTTTLGGGSIVIH